MAAMMMSWEWPSLQCSMSEDGMAEMHLKGLPAVRAVRKLASHK